MLAFALLLPSFYASKLKQRFHCNGKAGQGSDCNDRLKETFDWHDSNPPGWAEWRG